MKSASIPTAKDLGITGAQETMVYECLSDGSHHTLDSIRWHLLQCGVMARETTISARIRDINRVLVRHGVKIYWKYAQAGSRNTVYWLSELQG